MALLKRRHSAEEVLPVTLYKEVLDQQRRNARRNGATVSEICPALASVAVRSFTWSVSTSGLEQKFSKTAHYISTGQNHMSERSENALFLLITADLDEGVDDLIAGAQRIWLDVYKIACRRHKTGERLDIGVRHKWSKKPLRLGHRAFLQSRRRAISPQFGLADSLITDAVIDATALPDAMNKELAFMEQKTRKRKVCGYEAGVLLPDELDLEVLRDAELEKQRARKSRLARTAAFLRNQRVVNKSPIDLDSEFFNKTLCLDPTLENKWRDALIENGCTIGSSRDAQVFISESPLQLADPLMLWACVLRGGWIVSTDVIIQGIGVSLKLHAACLTRRYLYVTDQFKAHAPLVWDIINSSIAYPGSRINLLGSMEEFAARKASPANWKSASIVALVSDDEIKLPFFAGVPHVFDNAGLLALLYKQDHTRGTL